MPPDVMALRERAGELTGWAIAPAVRAASRARGARMFHPEGRTFAAQVTPLDATLGPRLAGPALVRLSAALWRNGFPHLDVLGIAIRFGWSAPDHGDQDLLFATMPSPLALALAPFTTRAGNYFANRFWAVAPFEVDGFGRVKLRLVPRHRPTGGTREEIVDRAIRRGEAVWDLEIRRVLRLGWRKIARIVLLEPAAVDQRHLRFSPFLHGRGLRPVGLVHAIRKATYRASQLGRGA